MPRRTLRSVAYRLSVATLHGSWIDSAPTSQSAVLVGYGSSLQTAPGATNAPGAASGRPPPDSPSPATPEASSQEGRSPSC